MKKTLVCILVLCLMLSVTACGKGGTDATEKNESEAAVSSQNESAETSSETEKPASTGSVTLEDVMDHPVTPVEDFEYEEDEETGGIGITNYKGNDDIVVIPDTIDGKPVTLVEKYSFDLGSTIKGIRLSDNVKVVDEGAFGLNDSVEIVVFGAGVTKVGASAFQDCVKLHTMILNDGLTTIDNLAFSGCEALKELEIPDSVTEMINSPFFGLDDDFTVIGKAGSIAEETAASNQVSFRAK